MKLKQKIATLVLGGVLAIGVGGALSFSKFSGAQAAETGTFKIDTTSGTSWTDETTGISFSGSDSAAGSYYKLIKTTKSIESSEFSVDLSKTFTIILEAGYYGGSGQIATAWLESSGVVITDKPTCKTDTNKSNKFYSLTLTPTSGNDVQKDVRLVISGKSTTASKFVRLYSFEVFCQLAANDRPKVTIDAECKNKVLSIGDSTNFAAETENADSASIVWSSSNEIVASISSSGVISALSYGETTIKASIMVDGTEYSDETNLQVKYPEPSVVENASFESICSNDEGYLKRKFTTTGIIKGWGADGTNSSADTHGNMVITDGVMDISCYGCTGGDATKLDWDADTNSYKYTGATNFKSLDLTSSLKIGDRIYIECVRKEDYNSKVQINAKITSVVLNELQSITLTPNKTEYLSGETVSSSDFTVVGHYAVAGDVAISSADCTINPSRSLLVTDDKVTISFGGMSASYDITVIFNEVDITDISFNSESVTLLSTDENVQLSVNVAPANCTEAVLWKSSNSLIASVDNNGLVTYVAPGAAVITATGEKGNVSSSVNVTCRQGALFGNIITDVLDREFTGVEDQTELGTKTYVDWTKASLNSSIVYSGQSSGDKNSIQLRSKNNTSGIITASGCGLYIAKIVVEWNDSTANGRTLDVYGNNTQYTSPTNLYDISKCGTKIGSITCSSDSSNELVINDGDYEYIGLRSNDGAMYINSITITWGFKKTATVADLDTLDTFIANYMHMDYTENLNYCADAEHHYYSTAKTAYNALTADQKAYFANVSVNTQYANAFARLQAWATANGESLDSDGNISSNNILALNQDNNAMIAVVVITMATLLAATAFFAIRKKKEN